MAKRANRSKKNTKAKKVNQSKKTFAKGELESYGLVRYSEKKSKSKKSSLSSAGMPDINAYSDLGTPTRKNINMV